MTISKNRCRVTDGEGAPSSVSRDGGDDSEVFDLDPMSVKGILNTAVTAHQSRKHGIAILMA
jgi:hypothetical protein